MSVSTNIQSVVPTPFLRQVGDALRQLVRITVTHDGVPAAGMLHVMADGKECSQPVALATGVSTLEVEVPEVSAPGSLQLVLILHGKQEARLSVAWAPPKRWVVHVVQLSHHDVGYTDLASNVLLVHDRWLNAAIDMAEATRDFPDTARFRMVVEQTWSIDHFLRTAAPERQAAMLDLLRRGDVELTALFGNITTELCGHETLARSVYHAFRLKHAYGIPLLSAEHNDIPGFSWGLSQVLIEAGIKFFTPALPLYYNWGFPDATSFWDEAKIFGAKKMPGAFWWEAPSRKRILFWCNNSGCGGDAHPDLPGLAERLQQLANTGYPYSVLRWPVQGGAIDNSPYIEGFSHTIRAWNARWAYPRLISSTNTRFYADLLPCLPDKLPVWRGELPGQDYPVGAASTAAATAVNRCNHYDVPMAETFGAVAGALTAYPSQREIVTQAYEEVLWHDEHTWGLHYPAGASACASELEKAVHAHRAAALAHDLTRKALAAISDAVTLAEPGVHLVVCNSLGEARSGIVHAHMRELANCGSTMILAPDGRLRGATLLTRHPEGIPSEFLSGAFELIDVATGAVVPYLITQIASPGDMDDYAAQRLGRGKSRQGLYDMNAPDSNRCTLEFYAEDVPALGYRSYRFKPCETPPSYPSAISIAGSCCENRSYQLEIDPATGCLSHLIAKTTKREWIDSTSSHPFGSLLVRDPWGHEFLSVSTGIDTLANGFRVHATAPGYPLIEINYLLPAEADYLEVAVRLLQDATPLQEAYLVFPFRLPDGQFRYQGPLCIIDPVHDLLPGAYADRLAVQDWVMASGSDGTVLWSSFDAPVVSLGCLWPGRVSPAHSAVLRADIEHPRPDAETLRGGTIYSLLTANNFTTNFAVSQSGEMRFRFRFMLTHDPLTDCEASRLGQQWQTPLASIMTAQQKPRSLPPSAGCITINPPTVRLVSFKQAEDGDGLILRLWNVGVQAETAHVTFPLISLDKVIRTNLAEEGSSNLICDEHHFEAMLTAGEVITVRLCMGEERK